MDFFERPDILTSGTRYKGPPASFLELTDAVSEGQRRVENNNAMWRQLEEAFDKRNDELEKAGIGRLYNPMRDPLTREQQEAADRALWRDYEGGYGQIGKDPNIRLPQTPMARMREDSDVARVNYLLSQYENDLKALEQKHPDRAAAIRASRSPLLEVAEQMRDADRKRLEAWESRSNISWLSPRTLEGIAAGLIGGLWGQRDSPVDLAANILGGVAGGRAQSLLRNAMKNALANAGVQTVLEPGIQAQRKAVGLESGVGLALEDILMAGAIGGGLDVAVRAPVRAINRARGLPGPYGTTFRDAPAPEPAIGRETAPEATPETAQPTPIDIPPDLMRRIEEGDPEAMSEAFSRLPGDVLENEPELRGAVAQAAIDNIAPVRIPGVDDGDGLRTFAQTLRAATDPQEPLPRMPDPVPDAARAMEPERGARLYDEYAGELDRLMRSAQGKLDEIDPRLVQRIDAAIEAGFGEVLPIVEDAVKAIAKGERESKVATRFVSNVLSLADEVGLDRLAAQADLHSGAANPVDLARQIRSMPDLIDSNTPMTEQVQMARSLARLSDHAFSMVERGEVAPSLAQVVSDHVADDMQHSAVLDGLKRAGISDPDDARRAIPDLMEPERDPNAIPLDGGSKIDDPAGKEAKAQTDRLSVEYEREIGEHAAKLEARKAQAQAARAEADEQAAMIQRADEVRAAVEGVMGMVPSDFNVKVFTGLQDMPPNVAAEVMRMNGVYMKEKLLAYNSARTDADRRAARLDIEQAYKFQGGRAFVDNDVLWIGAYAADPEATVAHEVVHALVKSGRMTAPEMRRLASAARDLGFFSGEQEAFYRNIYGTRPDMTPDKLAEMLDEEAAAHFVESWQRSKPETRERLRGKSKSPEQVDGIVARLQELFARIREALARALGAEGDTLPAVDLLDAVINGEIAKRTATARVLRENDVSAMAVRDRGAMSDRDTGQKLSTALHQADAVESFGKLLDFIDSNNAAVVVDKPDGLMFAFAGERSKTANLDALARAKAMTADGFSRKDVWDATDWFRHEDGRWLYEIDDSSAQRGERVGALSKALIHPALFEAYPDLKSVDVTALPGNSNVVGQYIRRAQTTTARVFERLMGKKPAEIGLAPTAGKDSLIHETQHAIDDLEGVFKAVDSANPYGVEGKSTEQMARDAKYKSATFEKLARAAQYRADLTPAERKATPPWLNYDKKPRRKQTGSAKDVGARVVWTEQNGMEVLPERAALEAAYQSIGLDPNDIYVRASIEGMKGAKEAISGTIRNSNVDAALGRNGYEGSSISKQAEWQAWGRAMEAYFEKAQQIGHNGGPDPTTWENSPFIYSLADSATGQSMHRDMDALGRGQVMFAFAGERAKTADLDALARANDMEAEGPPRVTTKGAPGYEEYEAHRRRIWDVTSAMGQGWFLAPDGRWKWEITDGDFTRPQQERFTLEGQPIQGDASFVYRNPDLFRAYPDLAGTPTQIDRYEPTNWSDQRWTGYMDRAGSIVGRADTLFDARQLIAHELQHGVQRQEGFARGGNPVGEALASDKFKEYENNIRKMKELIANPNEPEWLTAQRRQYVSELEGRRSTEILLHGTGPYKRLAGEVEARAVQKRLDMTPEQRRARPPWLDYDVPEDQQIVRFADGSGVSQLSYSAEPPVEGFPTIKGEVMFAIRAFHGSPHDFDRFDMSKIGTGEGAQAYGHGLYFAEREGVARSYRDALGGQRFKDGSAFDDANPAHQASAYISGTKSRDEALTAINDDIAMSRRQMDEKHAQILLRAKGMIQRGEPIPEMNQGRLYEVRINAEPEDFLDWDKPLSQQSEKVRKALPPAPEDVTGMQLINQLEQMVRASQPRTMADASFTAFNQDTSAAKLMITDKLREAGIPGIRYLDQGSRAKGEGSRNYVVFDDSLIEIVAKDGKPIDNGERQSVIDGMTGKSDGTGGPMFAMGDPPEVDQVALLTSRLSTLARGSGVDAGDVQARVQSALNLLTTAQDIAGERGIDTGNVVEIGPAALSQLMDIVGPERAQQMAGDVQAILKDIPTDPQALAARLNEVLDQYLPDEQPRMPANDNQDLGPMSPIEQDLYDMERIGAIIELIGVCR